MSRCRLLVSLIVLAACETHTTEPVELKALLQQEGGERILTLSHTPGEVASDAVAVPLAPDLIIGGGDDGFGYVVDVGATETGVFILDAMTHEVRGFDLEGRPTTRFGRKGNGPGEFRSPIAIEASTDFLVTWQYPATQALAVWDHSGGLQSAAGAPVEGDWDSGQWRKPKFIGPVDAGPEDLPQRLQFAGSDRFIHQIQPDDGPYRREGKRYPYEAPPAHLVRYGVDLDVIDTVTVLAGARLEVIEETLPLPNTDRVHSVHFANDRLYSGRPIWTTGDGWIGISHGDSAAAMIQGLDGEHRLQIRWPDRRSTLSDDDMRDAAKWMLAYQVVHATRSRSTFENFSRREIEEGIRVTAFEWTRFAELTPTITSAFGAGDCYFLAGFSPSENRYGVALTWLVLNVVRGSLEGLIRFEPDAAMEFGHQGLIDRRGGAVRAFTTRHAYLVTLDGNGESYVERFRLPCEFDCATERDAGDREPDMPGQP